MLLAGAVIASGCGSSEPEYALYGGPPDEEPAPPESSSGDVAEPQPQADEDVETVETDPPADIYGGPPAPEDEELPE
jgi:hypothetical protein